MKIAPVLIITTLSSSCLIAETVAGDRYLSPRENTYKNGPMESDRSADYADNILLLAADDERSPVNPPNPAATGRAMESAQEKVTDAWITAKVKSSFMYSKYVAASDIQVDTAGGVVTLLGSVDAEKTKEIAIELASTVHGVRKVNSTDLLVRNNLR